MISISFAHRNTCEVISSRALLQLAATCCRRMKHVAASCSTLCIALQQTTLRSPIYIHEYIRNLHLLKRCSMTHSETRHCVSRTARLLTRSTYSRPQKKKIHKTQRTTRTQCVRPFTRPPPCLPLVKVHVRRCLSIRCRGNTEIGLTWLARQ